MNRPKRVHRDPYENLLVKYIKDSDEAIRQLGGTPEPHPKPALYEPGEFEKNRCRDVLVLVEEIHGLEVRRAAAIAAGVEDGEPVEDDWDFLLYSDVLQYINETKGESAERHLLQLLGSR